MNGWHKVHKYHSRLTNVYYLLQESLYKSCVYNLIPYLNISLYLTIQYRYLKR